MKDRGISLIIVSHNNKFLIRRFFSTRFIRLSIVLGLVIAGCLIFLLVSYGPVYYRSLQIEYYRRRNQEIENEFKLLNSLKNELDIMRQENMKIRKMLGMEQVPPPLDISKLSMNINSNFPTLIKPNNNADEQIPSLTPVIGVVSKDYDLDHKAIDIAAPAGTMVFAPANGTIEKVAWDSIYGNSILVRHSEIYKTFFGHLQSIAVTVGQLVKKGDVIGYVGSSGRSSAPHLHYAVFFKGEPINPKPYMN